MADMLHPLRRLLVSAASGGFGVASSSRRRLKRREGQGGEVAFGPKPRGARLQSWSCEVMLAGEGAGCIPAAGGPGLCPGGNEEPAPGSR